MEILQITSPTSSVQELLLRTKPKVPIPVAVIIRSCFHYVYRPWTTRPRLLHNDMIAAVKICKYLQRYYITRNLRI